MSNMDLVKTAQAMVAEGKGILAIDESHGTCKKRFDNIGVACTEETRRDYRGMLLTTPGLGEFISGARTCWIRNRSNPQITIHYCTKPN